MKVRVTNIQRFSLQDGPGIRTTVFLKGCSICCPWCANPENIKYETQGQFGYDIELDELEKEILKDEKFYKLGGGVTFSGGEPLLQFDRLEPLLQGLNQQNINICIETALFVPTSLLEIALKYVDEFIVDIKILDNTEARKVLNADIELYYKNIQKLFQQKHNITFRIPVTKEYTLQEHNKTKILELLEKYKPKQVEIFKLHRLAKNKYETLKKEMAEFQEVTDDEMENFLKEIKNVKINARICKI